MDDHHEMQELFGDDNWDGIFDDDGPADEFMLVGETNLEEMEEEATAAAGSGSAAAKHHQAGAAAGGGDDETPPPDPVGSTDESSLSSSAAAAAAAADKLINDGENQNSSSAADDADGTTGNKRHHRRSSGRELESQLRGLPPPPSWHSEAADRPHRLEMITEVARLLQARKKSNPSQEWLRQLPHKARKLEERLYRNATSLESYLDKSTLKTRLKKLARMITRQFIEAKNRRGSKGRSSGSSFSSLSSFSTSASSVRSSMRDSISSVDSLRSLRDSLAVGASLNGQSPGGNDESGAGPRFSIDATSALNAIPEAPFSSSGGHETSSSSRTAAATAAESQSQSSQCQQQRLSNSLTSMPSGDNNISEIEKQKAINEQLQKQIMDNIRQQEELVRKMQASSSTSSGDNNNNNNNNNNNTTANQPINGQVSPQSVTSAANGQNSGGSIAVGNDSQPQGNGTSPQPVRGGQLPGAIPLQAIQGASLQHQQMNANLIMAQAQATFLNASGTAGSGAQFQQQQQGGPNFGAGGAMTPAPGLANTLIAMSNRNMLKQSFLQACQNSTTQSQSNQLLQQQTQQLPFMRGSAMLPNPVMAAAAAAAAAAGVASNMKPVIPIAGPPVSAVGLNLSMPPPPNMANRSAAQLSLQQSSGSSKNPVDEAEPLSPGSFNW